MAPRRSNAAAVAMIPDDDDERDPLDTLTPFDTYANNPSLSQKTNGNDSKGAAEVKKRPRKSAGSQRQNGIQRASSSSTPPANKGKGKAKARPRPKASQSMARDPDSSSEEEAEVESEDGDQDNEGGDDYYTPGPSARAAVAAAVKESPRRTAGESPRITKRAQPGGVESTPAAVKRHKASPSKTDANGIITPSQLGLQGLRLGGSTEFHDGAGTPPPSTIPPASQLDRHRASSMVSSASAAFAATPPELAYWANQGVQSRIKELEAEIQTNRHTIASWTDQVEQLTRDNEQLGRRIERLEMKKATAEANLAKQLEYNKDIHEKSTQQTNDLKDAAKQIDALRQELVASQRARVLDRQVQERRLDLVEDQLRQKMAQELERAMDRARGAYLDFKVRDAVEEELKVELGERVVTAALTPVQQDGVNGAAAGHGQDEEVEDDDNNGHASAPPEHDQEDDVRAQFSAGDIYADHQDEDDDDEDDDDEDVSVPLTSHLGSQRSVDEEQDRSYLRMMGRVHMPSTLIQPPLTPKGRRGRGQNAEAGPGPSTSGHRQRRQQQQEADRTSPPPRTPLRVKQEAMDQA